MTNSIEHLLDNMPERPTGTTLYEPGQRWIFWGLSDTAGFMEEPNPPRVLQLTSISLSGQLQFVAVMRYEGMPVSRFLTSVPIGDFDQMLEHGIVQAFRDDRDRLLEEIVSHERAVTELEGGPAWSPRASDAEMDPRKAQRAIEQIRWLTGTIKDLRGPDEDKALMQRLYTLKGRIYALFGVDPQRGFDDDGTSGQDRESYTDDQDRESYVQDAGPASDQQEGSK